MKRALFVALTLSSLIATGCAPQTADLLRQAELESIHGRNSKALELMNQAVALEPSSVSAYQARTFLYMRMKNHQKAISDLGKLIELEPHSPQHYMTRGLLYSIDEKIETALPDFRKACELHDDPVVHFSARSKSNNSLSLVPETC